MKEIMLSFAWYIFVAFIIFGVFEINPDVGLIVSGLIGLLHITWYSSDTEGFR